jgi:D-alanyl-D-alanine dipeptidase
MFHFLDTTLSLRQFLVILICIVFTFHFSHATKRNIASLVPIDPEKYNVIIDLRYATANNFTGKAAYKNNQLFLHKDVAKKLLLASQYAEKIGYKLKIFDGFRPMHVQEMFYKMVQDERYVSNPKKGVASHTRGVAIDLTLCDLQTGEELNMGTEFDSFEDKAHHSLNMTKEVTHNRLLLAGIMAVAGFTPLSTEWWHYNLRTYEDYPKYKHHPKLYKVTTD